MMKKANHNIYRQSYPLVLWSVMCLIGPASAVESRNATPPLVGHKPVLSQYTLPEGSIAPLAKYPVSDHAKVNKPLTLADMGIDISALIIDDDGDAEGGSTYEWLIDGARVETSATFTPAVEHGGQLLSVRVSPKTKTGTPDVGNAVTSNQIVVRSAFIDRFSIPSPTLRNWNQANSYCNNMGGGYRLPTRGEFLQLYREMTIATGTGNNVEICERYGWPLSNRCGGGGSAYSNYYWTRDSAGTYRHYFANMLNGISFNGDDPNGRNVTCIR